MGHKHQCRDVHYLHLLLLTAKSIRTPMICAILTLLLDKQVLQCWKLTTRYGIFTNWACRSEGRTGIVRQLPPMFRKEADLEDAWPQLSSDEQPLSNWIVSDAV